MARSKINYEYYFKVAPEKNVLLRQVRTYTCMKLREEGLTLKQIAKKVNTKHHSTVINLLKQDVRSSYIKNNYYKIIKKNIYPIRKHRDRIDWIALD
jgi:hypothetical protein